MFVVKGRQFEVKELFLEDILRLTGFNNKDMRKYKEETQRSMKLLLIGPLSQTEWKNKASQPSIRLCLNVLCVYHMLWFSEEKKQKRLTEWCKAVENNSVEEEQRTPVSAPRFLQDSSSLDRGVSSFNKLVNQQMRAHTQTICKPLSALLWWVWSSQVLI